MLVWIASCNKHILGSVRKIGVAPGHWKKWTFTHMECGHHRLKKQAVNWSHFSKIKIKTYIHVLRESSGENAPKVVNSSDFWMIGMSSFYFSISIYLNILHSTYTAFAIIKELLKNRITQRALINLWCPGFTPDKFSKVKNYCF